jgi:integrase
MFQKLFKYRAVVERHLRAPLAAERERYLRHLHQEGRATETLFRIARELLCVATILEISSGGVAASDIAAAGERWSGEQQQRGRAKTDKWSRLLFNSVATNWCRFLGVLIEDVTFREPDAFAGEMKNFADWLQSERGLSERTVAHYTWYIRDLLRWGKMCGWELRDISVTHVDEYLAERSLTGWSRVSTADAASALRVFFRHAFREGWCRPSIADAIQGPRIYRQEGLPSGPAWIDVIRLIESLNTGRPRDVRDKAMILLCAMYGLRSAEVRQLRLDDIDWENGKISVWRPKQQRRHEYPLTPTVGQSIIKYLSEVRPKSPRREVFLSLRAPFRPISGGAIYRAVKNRFTALEIASKRRVPHSLRQYAEYGIIGIQLPSIFCERASISIQFVHGSDMCLLILRTFMQR